MKTTEERMKNPSQKQRDAEGLIKDNMTEAMEIAKEALERAKLIQNKLFAEEASSIYRKVF